jgi:hypothetical protein
LELVTEVDAAVAGGEVAGEGAVFGARGDEPARKFSGPGAEGEDVTPLGGGDDDEEVEVDVMLGEMVLAVALASSNPL